MLAIQATIDSRKDMGPVYTDPACVGTGMECPVEQTLSQRSETINPPDTGSS